MQEDVVSAVEQHMEKAVEALRRELTSLRTGRANPGLLDQISVDYYGAPTPIKQLATVSAPEPRVLLIQPWDRTTVSAIEKAIMKSDLGLMPTNDGTVVRINLPQLTQERRREMVKIANKKAEEARVVVRNFRREANETIKSKEKSGEVPADEARRLQDKVQKLTDSFINKVGQVLQAKEEEIMEI